ncbi:hypothetical protein [Halococcus agarilyticus]|uniref:hypothetical protein n=1 Tax=Halococcus agarilyticus TaxID=1232219 RepID=UPI0006779156|nr:hypothetical protein [Halococcus agarilyticus]
MKRLRRRRSLDENYLAGTTADRLRVDRRSLLEAALTLVVALVGLAWAGTLLSTAPVLIAMIVAYALLTTLPVVVPYATVRAVTVLLERRARD